MKHRETSVNLREKKLANGMLGLYLDFYPPVLISETGKTTRREHLKIRIYEKPKTAHEKEVNRLGKAKADSIRSQREIQFMNKSFDFKDKLSSKMDFLAYFLAKVRKRNQSKGNYDNWYGAYKYLSLYTNGQCMFGDVNEKFCEGFKSFLSIVNLLSQILLGWLKTHKSVILISLRPQ